MASVRQFRIAKPWPTAFQRWRRIVHLMAIIALLQFILNALQLVVARPLMIAAWLVGGLAVAAATIQIETYFWNHRRPGP